MNFTSPNEASTHAPSKPPRKPTTKAPKKAATKAPKKAATKAPKKAATKAPKKAATEDPDAGEIWVVFRGSNDKKDTIADIKGILKKWPYGEKIGHVHMGFLGQYKQVREQIKAEVLRLIGLGHTKLHITGHSLGGALSELCAMDAAEYTKNTNLKLLTMTSFGSPDPADATWVANYDKKVKMSTRIVYESDIVSCVPGGLKISQKIHSFLNKVVGAKDSKKFKQVRSLLHFFKGKWRSIQWPKCNMYKQSLDDHSNNKYLNAVLNHPIKD